MRRAQNMTIPWWDKPVVYWHENQVALTFQSPVSLPSGPLSPKNYQEILQAAIRTLNLGQLDQFLIQRGFTLQSFTQNDVPRATPMGEIEKLEREVERLKAEIAAIEREHRRYASPYQRSALNGESRKTPRERDIEDLERQIEELETEIRQRKQQSSDVSTSKDEAGNDPDSPPARLISPTGKYLFRSPSGSGSNVISFFHVEGPTMTPSLTDMMSMGGNNTLDITAAVVTLINRNLDALRLDGGVPLIAASPHWLNGATDDGGGGTHGCPIVPPIPVLPGDACASSNRWQISLPQLSQPMQELEGDGVTVFVLDAFPATQQVRDAAIKAGNNNALLQKMSGRLGTTILLDDTQIILPPSLEDPNTAPRTGKDIYGRLIGFKMPDHGLFIAGILQDLVPNARIECMRVLNDYGVGDLAVLCEALSNIQRRMEGGFLGHQPVVINMSLVTTPPDEELAGLWFGDDCHCHGDQLAQMIYEIGLLRAGLHTLIKSLVADGAVIVAAAGNDSDVDPGHDSMLSHMSVISRMGPRYPAAFPEVISVGAVDKDYEATNYSDYPALYPNHNGIATYGGGRPTPVVPKPGTSIVPPPPPGAKTWAKVTDALVGVYSSDKYPELSINDVPPDEYDTPANNNGWAYWSGTSFAAPIISAVAARILQRFRINNVPLSPDQVAPKVQWALTNAMGQQAILGKKLSANTDFGPNVCVLEAVQSCQPVSHEELGTAPEAVPASD